MGDCVGVCVCVCMRVCVCVCVCVDVMLQHVRQVLYHAQFSERVSSTNSDRSVFVISSAAKWEYLKSELCSGEQVLRGKFV